MLLEVNASREASKHGFAPEEVPGLAGRLAESAPRARRGSDDDGGAMRRIREDAGRLSRRCGRCAIGWRRNWAAPLPHLSMGMSNDFEIAVEEGATLVRLGTVLFEGM